MRRDCAVAEVTSVGMRWTFVARRIGASQVGGDVTSEEN